MCFLEFMHITGDRVDMETSSFLMNQTLFLIGCPTQLLYFDYLFSLFHLMLEQMVHERT